MAYKSGRTHLTKREKTIRESIKNKDIHKLLWLVVEDSFSDIECGKEPRHGKQMLTFAMQQIAILEAKGKAHMKGDAENKIAQLKDWLSD